MSQPVVPEGTTTDPVEPQKPETDPTPSTTLSHEDALKELAKVRAEAADRRIKNRDLEDQAKKWREYEESQKSELQKLQEAVAERDAKLAEKELEVTRTRIAKEYEVDDADLDLLIGDEESMKRLASKLGRKDSKEEPKRPVDLLAGNRGTPVGKSSNFDMDAFIRGTARN
jgi:hypothetical protein